MILLYKVASGRFPYFVADTETGDCTFVQESISDSVTGYYKQDFRSTKLNDLKIHTKHRDARMVCIDISKLITTDSAATETLVYSYYPELLL